MDQHPIPQDVTGFQFKLIGTMTVKQFGYVAAGVVTAFALYYLVPNTSALNILIKFTLIPFFGGIGFVIAFVPIEGRPIDLMASNFAKALFSPNQYIYHKQGKSFSFLTVLLTKPPVLNQEQQQKALEQKRDHDANTKEKQLQTLLFKESGRAKNKQDEQEMAMLRSFSTMATVANTAPTHTPIVQDAPVATATHITPQTPVPVSQPVLATPTPQPVQVPQKETPEALSQKESALTQELVAAQQQEAQQTIPTAASAAHQKVAELQKSITDIHAEKIRLEQEIASLQAQLSPQKATEVTPPAMQTVPVQTQQDPQHVRSIPETMIKKIGLPHASDTPNVVIGIVKDPRGNVLPNMLVEIKDTTGNPVRAFKTNALGQFASATPLTFGTYTIELEDPKKQHAFDLVQIVANNQILMPIEIISHDEREALRQALFN